MEKLKPALVNAGNKLAAFLSNNYPVLFKKFDAFAKDKENIDDTTLYSTFIDGTEFKSLDERMNFIIKLRVLRLIYRVIN